MKGQKLKKVSYVVKDARIAIVVSSFNGDIVEQMLSGTKKTLVDNGIKKNQIEVIYVPGAFELPLICKKLADTQQFSAIIALGCVIRGDTPHFEYISGECARGIQQVALDTDMPVIFGVLTTENYAQAQERAAQNKQNKGKDLALSALHMINVIRDLA